MGLNNEIITSRQNRTVVETAKLTDRKTREATRCFRFDGIKLLEEALKKNLELCTVLLRQTGAKEILSRFPESDFTMQTRLLMLSDEVFDKISEEKSPEGVICIAKYIDKFQKNVTIYNNADFCLSPTEHIVLLESVRDPANIGAIIRSAAAIGVDRLIISEDCADIYHPRAVRASMGTLFDQRIDRVERLTPVIEYLQKQGRHVYAAALDPDACCLGTFAARPSDCVVIGNEGHGLSAEVMRACDRKVFIPMSGRAESLNASVAAAILMWEFMRKTGDQIAW